MEDENAVLAALEEQVQIEIPIDDRPIWAIKILLVDMDDDNRRCGILAPDLFRDKVEAVYTAHMMMSVPSVLQLMSATGRLEYPAGPVWQVLAAQVVELALVPF